MNSQFAELPIPTADGQFVARYSEKGLAELDFPQARPARRADRTLRRSVPTNRISRWHRTTLVALRKILAGIEPEKFPPLDAKGTKFQESVWDALRKISFGKTKSYGEIARAVGKPGAARAVGGACGANPIPVLVPCHRVLAANMKLGGFSSGLNWKRTLLAREGVGV